MGLRFATASLARVALGRSKHGRPFWRALLGSLRPDRYRPGNRGDRRKSEIVRACANVDLSLTRTCCPAAWISRGRRCSGEACSTAWASANAKQRSTTPVHVVCIHAAACRLLVGSALRSRTPEAARRQTPLPARPAIPELHASLRKEPERRMFVCRLEGPAIRAALTKSRYRTDRGTSSPWCGHDSSSSRPRSEGSPGMVAPTWQHGV
jgi:hypothetical protein